MEAKELRIGNYFMYGGKICQVHTLKPARIFGHVRPEWDGCMPDSCEGVPLTPEILEKSGFEKSGDNVHWFWGINGFCMIHDGEDWCIKRVINDNKVIAYCRYLHQLQNLFYCISSTELTIKL